MLLASTVSLSAQQQQRKRQLLLVLTHFRLVRALMMNPRTCKWRPKSELETKVSRESSFQVTLTCVSPKRQEKCESQQSVRMSHTQAAAKEKSLQVEKRKLLPPFCSSFFSHTQKGEEKKAIRLSNFSIQLLQSLLLLFFALAAKSHHYHWSKSFRSAD